MPPARLHARAYSASEHRADRVVHVTGLVFAALGVPLLIWLALADGGRADGGRDAALVGSVAIYAVALALMLGASALYNLTPGAGLNWLFRRVDHSAIYIKIAGTYTPFTFVTGQGIGLSVGLWVAAGLGVALKLASVERFRWLGLALYLGMGWAGVMIGPQVFGDLPVGIAVLVVAGGLIYTFGVVFFLWATLPYHYAIWHVFVLTATVLLYAAVLVLVLTPGGAELRG